MHFPVLEVLIINGIALDVIHFDQKTFPKLNLLDLSNISAVNKRKVHFNFPDTLTTLRLNFVSISDDSFRESIMRCPNLTTFFAYKLWFGKQLTDLFFPNARDVTIQRADTVMNLR